jgi:multidrug efflux pump subunit AcrB
LAFALRIPFIVSFVAFAIAGGLIVAALLTKEVVLLADEDIQRFDVIVQMPRTVSLDRTMEVLGKVEKQVAALPKDEIDGFVTEGGWRRGRTWPELGAHVGMVRVVLVPTNKRDRRGKAIMADLRERLARVTGPLTLEVRELSFKPPAGWPVAVRLSGESFKQLKRVSERVQEQIRQIKGVTAVSDDLQLGRRELRLRLDPHRASRYGLSHDQLAAFVRAAHGGLEVSRFRHRDEELDVVVRFRNAENRDLSGLATLNVNVPYASAPVPLSDLVRFDRGRGFAEINHRDQKRTVTITADLIEGKQTADGANREVRRRIANLVAANPEIDFAYGGEWEETERSVKSLFNAFAIAALLIFTILAAQFRSFAQPLVVILAIPLSLIGVVIGFFVSGEPVGLIALVGVVGLAGIAVNDATVLVDFINARRREGIEPVPAVLEACRLRMRPVMLTSITTIAGLFPLAMGWGGSSEGLKPMALAIVWGMTGCTLLTLVVVPCLYISVDKTARWLVPDWLRRQVNQHSETK